MRFLQAVCVTRLPDTPGGSRRYGTMKSLAPNDRPREKLDRLGPAGLGDNELLAVILVHGFRAASAIDVANDVLDTVRGVQGLTRQP